MARFDRIGWQGREALELEGAQYRVDGRGSLPFDQIPTDRFTLRKDPQTIDLYERFFSTHGFSPRRIFELGLYDGASLALWHDVLDPERIVGIDLQQRGDSPYFEQWVGERGRAAHVRTHWGVDQRDKQTLWEIAATEFDNEPIDLVIDDCSHIYGPTKTSFEALFPLVRSGGFYVIEDWAWEGSSAFGPGSGAALEGEAGLVELVRELVGAAASTERGLVGSLEVNERFVAVQRGPVTVFDPARFALEDFIGRGPARQDRSFVFSTAVAATPEEAFAAWTDPVSIPRWWDWDTSSDVTAKTDLRVGGAYEIAVPDDARRETVVGEYVELDAPRRLKQTFELRVGGEWYARAVVTALFRPDGDATQVILGFMDVEFRTTLVPPWWERSWNNRLDRFSAAQLSTGGESR